MLTTCFSHMGDLCQLTLWETKTVSLNVVSLWHQWRTGDIMVTHIYFTVITKSITTLIGYIQFSTNIVSSDNLIFKACIYVCVCINMSGHQASKLPRGKCIHIHVGQAHANIWPHEHCNLEHIEDIFSCTRMHILAYICI